MRPRQISALAHHIEPALDRVAFGSVTVERPTTVAIFSAAGVPERAVGTGDTFRTANAEIALIDSPAGLAVEIRCPTGELTQVVMRWQRSQPAGARILADAWERGYGDLEWRAVQPER